MREPVRARTVDGAWRPAALALVAELERRGLLARVMGHGALRVRNPAGEPDPGDPQGQGFGPGLGQEVVCRRRDGVLWWLWVWSGPTRTSPPELEPLCPVADAAVAVERITRVLAVPFASSPNLSSGGVPGGCR
ncbi:hypothetical protein [Actinomadura sp. B10D3]|uniref:hypothetical protein n=1 Tax=Actinomadura sp. B10D3 TaxID=3153557 RepID=UPI00325E1AF2